MCVAARTAAAGNARSATSATRTRRTGFGMCVYPLLRFLGERSTVAPIWSGTCKERFGGRLAASGHRVAADSSSPPSAQGQLPAPADVRPAPHRPLGAELWALAKENPSRTRSPDR